MRPDPPRPIDRRTALQGLAGGLAALAGLPAGAAAQSDPDATVSIVNFAFEPATVEVAVGETVRWTWEDAGHNVRPTSIPDGSDWSGEAITTYPAGHEYSHTFEVPGTYEYDCRPHSDQMQGTVEVVGDEPCPDAEGGSAEVEGRVVCDVNDDGHYRDFNADGSVTQADVTEFFSVQHQEGFQDNPGMFDFNDNEDVGLDDVVYLFQQL